MIVSPYAPLFGKAHIVIVRFKVCQFLAQSSTQHFVSFLLYTD
jgi:hypothetical protein